MGILRFVLWSSLCVGFGIFLATADVSGRTPWQLMQGTWKQQGPRLEKVKGDAEVLADEVKKKVSTQENSAPKERHSEDERKAIDAIISKRTKG